MAPSTDSPVRLRGTALGLLSRSAAFLAADHLLAVRHYGYVERYQRFPYRNIQALIVHRTRTGLLLHAGLGVAVLIWIGAAAWMHRIGLPSAAVFFFGLVAVTGLLILFHAAMGPTCCCRVQTAVQTAELPSLRRLRHARSAMRRLAPRIAEVQGPLPDDFLEACRRQAGVAAGPHRPPPLPEGLHAG